MTTSAPPVAAIDGRAAHEFLCALGKTPETTRLRAFPHRSNPNKWHEKDCPDGIKSRKGPFDLYLAAQWQAEGRGIYAVIGNGGDRDAQIESCPAFFLEWDNKPLDWQLTAWQEFGFGEPSLIVTTGGKSAHCYWLLATPISPDQWRPVQAALIEITGADPTNRNPSRVMRLPGAWYVNEHGQPIAQTRIYSNQGHRYQLAEIESWILAAADQQQTITAPVEGQTRPGISLPPLPAPTHTPRTLDDIRSALAHIPPRPGAGTGTYHHYRNILWGLIAACEEAGADRDVAIGLMEAHSPAGWDVRQVGRSGGAQISSGTFWYHARQHGWRGGAGSTATAARAAGQQGQQEPPGGPGAPGASGAQQTNAPDGCPPPPPDVPRHQQIQTLLDHLLDLLLDPSDTWAEQQAARAELWNLGVRGDAIDDRILYALSARWDLPLQQGHSGARRGRSLADPVESPADDLLPGFLLWQRDHVLFGAGGAGKTMAAAAMGAAIIKGRPFLDQEIPPHHRGRVLWIGSDGGEGARAMVLSYLQDLNLADDPEIIDGFTLWTAEAADGMPAWCCSPRGLLELRDELETGGYALVVIDSLKAVLELAGINFAVGPVGTLLRLMQALVGRHCSLLWLHHPAGGKAAGKGLQAAAGSQNINQIPSAVHQLTRVSSDRGPVNEWIVHKLRGSQSREFKYRLVEDGFEITQGEITGNARRHILRLLLERSEWDAPPRTSALVEQLPKFSQSTIRNNLTWLRQRGLIRKAGNAWHLTQKGETVLMQYNDDVMTSW